MMANRVLRTLLSFPPYAASTQAGFPNSFQHLSAECDIFPQYLYGGKELRDLP